MSARFEWRKGARIMAAAGVVAMAAGCSSSSSSGATRSSNGAAATDSSATPRGSSSGGAAAASAAVATAAKPPTFQAPGPAFAANKAKGKKLWVIDVASSIPLTTVTDDAAKSALGLAGASLVRFDGKGSVSEFARGINAAIADKASGIALFAIDPALVAGPVKKATDAGIPIIVLQYGDASAQMPLGLKAQATYCYSCAGEDMANSIIADSKGAKVGVDLIVSNEVSNSKPLIEGFTRALKAGCTSCSIQNDNVPIADWQTNIPTTVRSNISGNRNIKYVVPIYDGMALFAIPAIQTSGRSDVKIVTFNASLGVMQNLAATKVVVADVGSPQAWEGWAMADQFMRVVTGQQPIQDEKVGLRLFDKSNIGSIDLGKPEQDWYGVSFEAVYRQMWQLG